MNPRPFQSALEIPTAFNNPKGIEIIQPRVGRAAAYPGAASTNLINSERVESIDKDRTADEAGGNDAPGRIRLVPPERGVMDFDSKIG